MRRLAIVALKTLLIIAMAHVNVAAAQGHGTPPPAAPRMDAAHGSVRGVGHVPQPLVVCTGWHAYCPVTDCKIDGDKANCDCYRVNETNIVETDQIQDVVAKRMTEARCTLQHPCDVDQAPVCEAIRNGRYRVGDVDYEWVSTYSYRGWCSLLKQDLVPCDPTASGYSGNVSWAICDAVPCTESQSPSDPERPLSCRCNVVEKVPFVGFNGSCTGDGGGIMSSFPASGWDFENNTYRFPMPGYEYVRGACAPLKSDPIE